MDYVEFWKIISMFDWTFQEEDLILQEALSYLSQKSNDDLYEFQEILCEQLFELDGYDYAVNCFDYSYVDEQSFSLDDFLYARCACVAKGEMFYKQVLNHPTMMPKNVQFESLLYLVDKAYMLKNNSDLDYITIYSYETYSNKKKWSKN